ncbi:MAG: hypothetical protein HY074_15295 [Deltaproteobacteria bacterium]|nr:hypothetical protein [Deltaproteobacteria bacterium]
MCIACIEFIKDKLTLKEFQAALGETSRDDKIHLEEVSELMRQNAADPKELRKSLEKLTTENG